MKPFIPSFFIAAIAVFFSASAVSAATYTVADCTDLQTVDAAMPLDSADIVNVTADFSCDTVIGDGGNPFTATFDGNGFTITHTNANLSLFSQVEGATIRDLTVSTTFEIISGTRGGLINEVVASSTATNITNVTTTANITANSGLSTVGGFIGLTNGVLNITSSTFNGSLTYTDGSPSRVGALIGYAQSDSVTNAITLTGNTVSGDITMTGMGLVSKTAGLVGELEDGSVTAIGNTISSDITVSGTSEFRYSGSLIGEMAASTSFTSTNDTVSGSVSSTMGSTVSSIGGSVGVLRSGATVTVTGTTFSGAMNLTGPYVDSNAIIGIGQNQGATTTFSNITSSRTATFTNDGTGVDSISDIGGLYGYFDPDATTIATINNVDMSGTILLTRVDNTVTSTNVGSIGGYIGETYSTSTIVISGGTVSSDITVSIGDHPDVYAGNIGGLIGVSDYGPLSITNLTMSGDITIEKMASSSGNDYIGGLVGELDIDDSSATNTVSVSGVTVSGDFYIDGGINVDDVGGIFGNMQDATLTVTNTIVSSNFFVTSTEDINDVGGFLGSTDSDDAVISNSQFTGGIRLYAGDGADSIGGFTGESENDDMLYQNVTSTGDIMITANEAEDIGGLIGLIYYDTYLNNVSVTGDITITVPAGLAEGVGGVIGWVDEYEVWATSTYYTGDINVVADEVNGLAGFIGFFNNDDDSTFYDIVVSGTVSSTASDIVGVGGIIGEMEDFYGISLINATSSMDIILSVSTSSASISQVGGIMGYHDEDDDEMFLLTNVVNTGDITINAATENTEVYDIGGIYGYYDAEDDNEDAATQILNSGDITIYASATSTEVYSVGGIAGLVYDWFSLDTATSTGDITIYVAAADAYTYNVGGLVGSVDDEAYFNATASLGDITIYAAGESVEVRTVGGLIGQVQDETEIYNTYSLTDITVYANASSTDIDRFGGIIGNIEESNLLVSSTYYIGDILLEGGYDAQDVGGIIGYSDYAQVDMYEVYAIVDIDVSLGQTTHRNIQAIGGLVGDVSGEEGDVELNITNGFAAGTIDLTAIVGTSESDANQGIYEIGGVVGEYDAGTLTNVYGDVDIMITADNGLAPREIGGIIGEVGNNDGVTVKNSFAAGGIDVTSDDGSDFIGAVFGYIYNVTSTGNYYDIYRTGFENCNSVTSTSGCTGYNENNYAATSGYLINTESNPPVSSWNFDDVWQTDSDYYPVLAFAPYDGSITLGTESGESSSGGSSYVPPAPPRMVNSALDTLEMDEDGARVSGAFTINSGAAETDSRIVTLNFIDIENASQVAVSENSTFAGVSFQTFSASLSYTLSTGSEEKTVYAKLRSPEGATLTLKDSIVLVGEEEPTTETPIDPNQGLQCTSDVYLTTAVGPGRVNNPADVRLLEEFLNTYENTNLPVNGIYESADIAAVIAWQEKHAADILAPWGITNGTGYVFTTSLAKIKQIHEANCATAAPAPTTPVVPTATTACLNTTDILRLGMNNAFVATAQRLLKNLSYFPADIDTTGYFGPVTENATRAFQGANGIDQVGFIGPQTRARLNELGCN